VCARERVKKIDAEREGKKESWRVLMMARSVNGRERERESARVDDINVCER